MRAEFLLKEIAHNELSMVVKIEALSKLEDKKSLSEIAKNYRNYWDGEDSVKKLDPTKWPNKIPDPIILFKKKLIIDYWFNLWPFCLSKVDNSSQN